MVRNGKRILVWNMEDAQNGMKDLKNGMQHRLPYFHTNFIPVYGTCQNLQQIAKYYQTRMRILFYSHFSVLYCKFLWFSACCDYILLLR